MKRVCLLLTLIMIFSLAGCCYAPGYQGKFQLESMFSNVPTLPAEEYIPVNNTAAPTEDSGAVEDFGLVAIPDPEIDWNALPVRADTDFVNVLDYIPDMVIDLQYATVNNFTGKVVYKSNKAFLRYGTVKKLMDVQKELRTQGYLLKLWDGYRTVGAHKQLWYANPDPNYIADPATGGSSHSRGNTVDITVVDANGQDLVMPTGFDDFTVLADRDYSDCSAAAAENATMLQELMEKYGFIPYESEWWHFRDSDDYPVEQVLDPDVIANYYAKCNEYISLRSEPNTGASVLTKILVDEQFTLLGYVDDYFCWVEYNGQRGYVLIDYVGKVR